MIKSSLKCTRLHKQTIIFQFMCNKGYMFFYQVSPPACVLVYHASGECRLLKTDPDKAEKAYDLILIQTVLQSDCIQVSTFLSYKNTHDTKSSLIGLFACRALINPTLYILRSNGVLNFHLSIAYATSHIRYYFCFNCPSMHG